MIATSRALNSKHGRSRVGSIRSPPGCCPHIPPREGHLRRPILAHCPKSARANWHHPIGRRASYEPPRDEPATPVLPFLSFRAEPEAQQRRRRCSPAPSCVRIHDGRGWLLPLLFVVAQVAQAVAGLAHFLTGLALDLLALAFSLGLGIIGHVAPGLLGFPLELFALALYPVAVVPHRTHSFPVFAISAAPRWVGQ